MIDELNSYESNLMMIIYFEKSLHIQTKHPYLNIGWSVFDASTGKSECNEIVNQLDEKIVLDEIYRLILQYNPRELVYISNTSNPIDSEHIVNYLGTDVRCAIHNKLNLMDSMYEKIAFQSNILKKAFSDTGKCLVVRFPFNMKYSKLITEIKKFILFPSEGYKSDNYKHIFPYNETIVYKTIDLFKGHIKDIQSELLDIYNQIDGYRNAPEKHIPGIYGLQIKNTPEFIAQSVVDKIGDPTLENLFLYHDKRDQIGLVHFDKEDLTSSTQNLKPLTKKILSRNHSFIQINKKQHPINEVLETLLELQRFPLLVILDDKEPLDQLVQFHNLTKNIIPIEKISVMFRKENRKEGRHFNDYVKSQNLNNKLDINSDGRIIATSNKYIYDLIIKYINIIS